MLFIVSHMAGILPSRSEADIENELLDDVCELIPDDFFNSSYRDRRTRKTVAILDYIYALATNSVDNPGLSDLGTDRPRREALKALKEIIPDDHYFQIGAYGGKGHVDAKRSRTIVLKAAKHYIEHLARVHGLYRGTSSSTAAVAPDIASHSHEQTQRAPGIRTPAVSLGNGPGNREETSSTNTGSTTPDVSLNRPVSAIMAELRNIYNLFDSLNAENEHLREKVHILEEEQRPMQSSLKRADLQNAHLRSLIVAAGVSADVVEEALGQLANGMKVENVVMAYFRPTSR